MKRYEFEIALRGLVWAESEEAAMKVAEEHARNIATGDVGHLSDHQIDETEATRVTHRPETEGDD